MQMKVNTVGNSAFSVNPFIMLHEKYMQMSFGLGYMALTDLIFFYKHIQKIILNEAC